MWITKEASIKHEISLKKRENDKKKEKLLEAIGKCF